MASSLVLRSSVPVAGVAALGRLEIRLRAIPQAVDLVSTPLKALYDSLKEALFNALADPTSHAMRIFRLAA